MSLLLNTGNTSPEWLTARTSPMLGQIIELGDYEISMVDFLILAHYVLTNTDLEENDPRLQFVECIRHMSMTESRNSGEFCLQSCLPPVQTG